MAGDAPRLTTLVPRARYDLGRLRHERERHALRLQHPRFLLGHPGERATQNVPDVALPQRLRVARDLGLRVLARGEGLGLEHALTESVDRRDRRAVVVAQGGLDAFAAFGQFGRRPDAERFEDVVFRVVGASGLEAQAGL